MDKGTFSVYQMVQPLIDGGGILDYHQIFPGEGVEIVHQQLKNMDSQGEIVALGGKTGAA